MGTASNSLQAPAYPPKPISRLFSGSILKFILGTGSRCRHRDYLPNSNGSLDICQDCGARRSHLFDGIKTRLGSWTMSAASPALSSPSILAMQDTLSPEPGTTILVFETNLAGAHYTDEARFAVATARARWNVAEGITGNAYALPTCDEHLKPRSAEEIAKSVDRFLGFAARHSNLGFDLSRLSDEVIAVMCERYAPASEQRQKEAL
jgi:hypothetical protein